MKWICSECEDVGTVCILERDCIAEPHACPDAFTRAAWYQVVSQETVDNIIKECNDG